MHSLNPRHTLTFSIWIGYLFFVVYGSLVPLDFRPVPFDQAWAIFQHIPMYKLGVESRADWISNGVLYVPVGFLTAHLLVETFSEVRRVPLFLLAGLFSVALAFCVEFTQIFFPQRTVSLNDLLAESVGSIIGMMLLAWSSDWFRILLHAVFSNPRRLALRLVEAYLAGYVAFSLFPYDILLSGAELAQKMRGDNWGWLLAGGHQGKILIALKAVAEVILTIPFGLFLGYRSACHSSTYKQAIWWGLLLGGFIEIAQFFTATGVSQGLSVATRVAGVCGGLALWQRRSSWPPERLTALIRHYTLPVGVIYLLVLLQVNGWFSHRWNGADFAVSKFGGLHFLPFYYHYFTTEARALFSMGSVCLMYLPVGLLAWSSRHTPLQALFYGMLSAALVEAGKLFLQGMHPDPTNIMLGAFASWATARWAIAFSEAATTPAIAEPVESQPQKSHHVALAEKPLIETRGPPSRWKSRAVLLPALAFAAYWAATFPTQPVLLCLFLTACAANIWHRPALLFAILPAALPILDLAPWSGRFYFDEFDLLLLIGLAIGYARIPPLPNKKRDTDALFSLASGLVVLSFVISAVRGLTPWQMPDANAFTNYYSPFNALRIGKGVLWAFLCYGLLRRFAAAEIDIKRPLAFGMVSGLALTVAVILLERMTFVSLFDFTSDYRVTGSFSAMHMGGAYIECFLAIATPFLVLLTVQTTSWASRLAGAFLLVATTYAMMVTFSRNGYSAFGVVLAIILFFALFDSGQRPRRGALVAALTAGILAVALPVFTGQFAQDRIASAGKDYAIRLAHWEDALGMRTPDLLTTAFGMGLGRYPESHYLLSRETSHAGTYQLKTEDENTFLRLGLGDSIYVEQIVSIEPRQNYVLKLNVRAGTPDEKFAVSLCEKWMLTSFNCIPIPLIAGNVAGAWHSVESSFKTDTLGDDPWYGKKPVKLALHTPRGRSPIDIDNLRLETVRGENLLQNGDFSKELDHWFFSADNHLQWHAKSLPVAVLFDQGWFGLIVLCMFAILVIKRAAGRAWRGDLHAAATLASFGGFLVVGIFDTLIDAPRFLFLLLMLGWSSGLRNTTDPKGRQNG